MFFDFLKPLRLFPMGAIMAPIFFRLGEKRACFLVGTGCPNKVSTVGELRAELHEFSAFVAGGRLDDYYLSQIPKPRRRLKKFIE